MAAADEMFADSDGVLAEELAVLESIYMTELSVEKDEQDWPATVSMLLHPSTGMDQSKKFVCMTLHFNLPHTYPDKLPGIVVKNPRGIGQEEVHSLVEDMKKLAEERKGGPMLFELIEMAKDCLTDGNIPHCECAICLENFGEGEDFVKTDCYHYFHRSCLARFATAFLSTLQQGDEDPSPRHAQKQEKVLCCPMCREPLSVDLAQLLTEPVPAEEVIDFRPTSDLVRQQRHMAALYQRQKDKGGIIDLEHEKNKFLVDKNTVVSLVTVQKDAEADGDHPSTGAVSPVKGKSQRSTSELLRGVRDSEGADSRPHGGRGGSHRAGRGPSGRDHHGRRKDYDRDENRHDARGDKRRDHHRDRKPDHQRDDRRDRRPDHVDDRRDRRPDHVDDRRDRRPDQEDHHSKRPTPQKSARHYDREDRLNHHHYSHDKPHRRDQRPPYNGPDCRGERTDDRDEKRDAPERSNHRDFRRPNKSDELDRQSDRNENVVAPERSERGYNRPQHKTDDRDKRLDGEDGQEKKAPIGTGDRDVEPDVERSETTDRPSHSAGDKDKQRRNDFPRHHHGNNRHDPGWSDSSRQQRGGGRNHRDDNNDHDHHHQTKGRGQGRGCQGNENSGHRNRRGDKENWEDDKEQNQRHLEDAAPRSDQSNAGRGDKSNHSQLPSNNHRRERDDTTREKTNPRQLPSNDYRQERDDTTKEKTSPRQLPSNNHSHGFADPREKASLRTDRKPEEGRHNRKGRGRGRQPDTNEKYDGTSSPRNHDYETTSRRNHDYGASSSPRNHHDSNDHASNNGKGGRNPARNSDRNADSSSNGAAEDWERECADSRSVSSNMGTSSGGRPGTRKAHPNLQSTKNVPHDRNGQTEEMVSEESHNSDSASPQSSKFGRPPGFHLSRPPPGLSRSKVSDIDSQGSRDKEGSSRMESERNGASRLESASAPTSGSKFGPPPGFQFT